MASRARALAQNVGLAAAALGLAFLLAETALRLSGYAPPAFAGAACIFDGRRSLLLDCYPTNPRGYFDVDLRDAATLERYRARQVKRLERAAARAPFAVESRYNALGYRGPLPGPRRAGVRRVLVLGDSFTEGQGVKEADAYPRALERLLAAGAPDRYEVLNCGRRASDFPELRSELDEALALEPDLVVYAMVLNDAEPVPELRARFQGLADLITDRRQGDLAWRYERLGPFDSRLLALVRGRWQAARLRSDSLRAYGDLYGPPNAAGWARTQAQLREMQAATRARGAGFLLVLWPVLVDLDGRYPLEGTHATIARFCAEAGLEFVDLLPALRGQAAETLWVHPIDHHPNERAHRSVAERLLPEVQRRLPGIDTAR